MSWESPLCFGGPFDGQRYQVQARTQHLDYVKAGGFDASDNVIEIKKRYTREQLSLNLNGSRRFYAIFVDEDASVGDVIAKLQFVVTFATLVRGTQHDRT